MTLPPVRDLVRWIGLPLAGAVVALAAERLLVPGLSPVDERTRQLRQEAQRELERLRRTNSGLEERFRIAVSQLRARQEMEREQFFRLQRYRRFGELGAEIAHLILSPSADTPEEALADGREVKVPRLALDPDRREEWRGLRSELSGMEEAVDPRVYEAFREVVRFVDAHPWPSGEAPAGLAGSGWTEPGVVERWLSLNRALVATTESVGALGGS